MLYDENMNQEIIEEEVELTAEALEDVAGGKIRVKIIATSDLKVHAAPDAKSAVLGMMKPKEKLHTEATVKDKNGVPWYRVKFQGQKGYICSKSSGIEKTYH